ncbi:MAG: protein kinase [Planctomycetota bacterium]|nr:protein kinase [Planctomycetota bacterium]
MQGTQPSALPRLVGGFRLVRELGRGGMGVVYEAHEIDSGRIVALKVLAAELSVSGEAFERFRREARLAASISDVRCVFVYGAHQIDDSPAIAMELVGGETLQDKITRGDAIPIETAVRWAIDVIDGLEAAHRAGVIHRDVKPSNCFVTTDGQVKIGDFGLSRTLERDIELTQSGQFLGSPLYASPEQIRGRTVDARSDQYSCAATLYALLAGRSPFGGNNVGEVLARILSEPPPRLHSIRPEIARELEKVVLRGMEREPEKRYRDLDAFRAALVPFSSQAAAAASIPRRLAAWALDSALIAFVSSSIGTLIQTSHDLFIVDQERPWLTIPLATQLALGTLPILYFALSEGFFSATIGKWLLGLRIASVGRGPSLWVRAIPRAFLYEIVAILLLIPMHVLPGNAVEYALFTPLVFGGTFLFRLCSMRKHNGWRGPYELWTGTRVIQSRLPFRRLRRIAPPPESRPAPTPELPEKLGEYKILGLVGNTASGALLHARDERLERSVWIQFRESGLVAGEIRRSLSRPNRLRWLESLRGQDRAADVFESPGGCGLSLIAQRTEPLDWPMAERALAALAEELARSEAESAAPGRWSANQVWLDRNWNVRVLDEPVPTDRAEHDALGLLGAAARALLGVGPERELPPDLPVHAETLVRSLTGTGPAFRDLDAARSALATSQAAAANVERRTRSAQLAVSTALLALFATFSFFAFLLVVDFMPHAAEMRGVLRELKSGRVAASSVELNRSDDPSPSGPELDEQTRRWRSVVLSYESSHGFGTTISAGLREEDNALVAEARRVVPTPTEAEFELARQQIRAQRGSGVDLPEDSLSRFSILELTVLFVASATGAWTLFALLSALVWPGGLSFRLFGLSIRRRNGRRASRPFGLVRTAVFAVPLAATYFLAFRLIMKTPWIGWTIFAVAATLHLAGIAASIAEPSRGPIDRLLKSRIVPR